MTTELVLPDVGALVTGEQEALAAFVDEWLRNRRVSDNTREAYRRDVLMWLAWCARNGVNPLQATFVHVNAWGRELEATIVRGGNPMAKSSVARRMSAVSSFYDYLVKLGVLMANPAGASDRPKRNRRGSKTVAFTADEAGLLLASAAANDPIGDVAEPLAELLVALGNRATEFCTLDVPNLGYDGGHRIARFTVKGGLEHVRIIPPNTGAALDRYLLRRADRAGVPVDQLTGPLLLDAQGRRLDRHAVKRFVKRLARRAGLPNWKKITPHSFRHAWNRIAKKRGATLEQRQRALGHVDPRTTQGYDDQIEDLAADPAYLVAAELATIKGT